MRYQFIDEVLALDLGSRPWIHVRKTFPTDAVRSGLSASSRLPQSLMLELMAMTGGHLLFRHLGQGRLPLLMKVPECRFDRVARTGVPLSSRAALHGVFPVTDDAVMAEMDTEVEAESERICSGRLLYYCVTLPPSLKGARRVVEPHEQ